MGLLVLIAALVDTISDTVKGRVTDYWEYNSDDYIGFCDMLDSNETEDD